MKIELPDKVASILQSLRSAGFEAFAVGGCVRDSLLDKVPEDWDITTSAFPEQVKSIFKRTVDTGIEHGTVTVLLSKDAFEVTTYRIDGEYKDSRHPGEVMFTPSLTEDLKRRDFTINAMAYNQEEGLIDIFGGIEDLSNGLIRCVGEPTERFGEDALRIMRAVRFAAQLGYRIEENTKDAIIELAPTLKNISVERIQTELVKLITSSNPMEMMLLYETGITKVILPEFDDMMETKQNSKHHIYNVGLHCVHTMQHVRADKVIRLAALFHDVGKPDCRALNEEGIFHFTGHAKRGGELAEQILKRLRFDNDTIRKVTKLITYHSAYLKPEPYLVRKTLSQVGEELFPLLLEINYADIMAQSQFAKESKLEKLKEIEKLYHQVILEGDCISLKTMAVTGRDLLELGIQPGREIGIILDSLFTIVLENPACNTKEYLLRKICRKS